MHLDNEKLKKEGSEENESLKLGKYPLHNYIRDLHRKFTGKKRVGIAKTL
jgi:hypothetical protein